MCQAVGLSLAQVSTVSLGWAAEILLLLGNIPSHFSNLLLLLFINVYLCLGRNYIFQNIHMSYLIFICLSGRHMVKFCPGHNTYFPNISSGLLCKSHLCFEGQNGKSCGVSNTK